MVSYEKTQIIENLENNIGNDINFKKLHLNYIDNIYLSSVKKEVDKHSGDFKIFSVGNTFSVEINIPINKTNSNLRNENPTQSSKSNLDPNKNLNLDHFNLFLKKLYLHIFNIIKIFFAKNS